MSAPTAPGAPVQLVWLRRDLRPDDHPLLHDAARRGPVLPVVIVEPTPWADPTFGARHWTFARACLAEVDAAWRPLGAPLRVRRGDAVEALGALCAEAAAAGAPIGALWWAAEPGRRAGARDAAVEAMAGARGLAVHARPADDAPGRPAVAAPERLGTPALDAVLPGAWATASSLGLPDDGWTDAALDDAGWTESGRRRVAGGAAEAGWLLRSFLAARGQRYAAAADDPVAAPLVRSRLGAHLAFGAISPAAVGSAVHAAVQERSRRRPPRPGGDATADGDAWRASLAAFGDALAARAVARQRFAARPGLEPADDDGSDDVDGDAQDRLTAWRAAATGRPLVDAALRQLRAIGWLPFRLRAIVTSYAVHDLGLPWPRVGRELARLCVDADPAVLWPAVRRIAGALDDRGPRVYNPDRQAQALDPDGRYVRSWLPALAAVPDSFVHHPWRMPPAMQSASGCRVGRDWPALVPGVRAPRPASPPPRPAAGGGGPRQLRLGDGGDLDGDGGRSSEGGRGVGVDDEVGDGGAVGDDGAMGGTAPGDVGHGA